MTTSSTGPDIVTDGVSTTVPSDVPPDELAALRSVALRNMRLLRAQIVPLIDAALRSGGGERDDHRARWIAAALRLIDETTVAAAAGATGGPVATVDLCALLARAVEAHADRLGRVTVAALPLLVARRDHLALLVGDMIKGIARSAPHTVPAGLYVDWVRDGDGSAVIRFCDAETKIEGQVVGREDAGHADRGWSMCQTLITGMGGSFHLSQAGRGRLCLALRFPAELVLDDGTV